MTVAESASVFCIFSKSNEQNICLEAGNSRCEFPFSILFALGATACLILFMSRPWGDRLEYHKFEIKRCGNLKNSKNFAVAKIDSVKS